METRLSLAPGQHGTKKLLREYGDRLVCVRYRYDSKRGKRYKTAEIIIEEIDWKPQPAPSGARAKRNPNDRVGVRIAYHESELRAKMKKAGAIWRPKQQIRELPYGVARDFGLTDRVLGG